MSLTKYKEKRNFSHTPEPPPATEHSPGGNLFCIQRHDATRLHYDFRLEVEGAMVSWAVTKGPSLNPADKRLAVKVEDHPLSYAKFEGNIPAGNYGGGSVMLWDLGTWKQEIEGISAKKQIEKGELKFSLAGSKLQGSFVLVRMKDGTPPPKENWLLIKHKDEFASAEWKIDDHATSVSSGRTQDQIAAAKDEPAHEKEEKHDDPFPGIIKPMLAVKADEIPVGGEWMFEVKWDGVRALAYISKGKTLLRSRKGDDISAQYPELKGLAKEIQGKDAVLDGEVVVCDAEGRPRFQLIQPRIMGRGKASEFPARFIAFDLLYSDGQDLREQTLRERKERLGKLVKDGSDLQVSQEFAGSGRDLLEAVKSQGMEGIMAKRVASRYVSARTEDWRKIKAGNEGDFLICGYTKGERHYFGALILGERKDGDLVYCGNVGTGFDEATLAELYRQMEPLQQKLSPFKTKPKIPHPVVWLKPDLTCAIRYHERTDGGKLRAPVFAGLRETETTSFAQFTHLSKVLFPDDAVTKKDLLEYYDAAAEWLAPHLKDRPLSLLRYPNGIASKSFFQKNAEGKLPGWFRTEKVGDMVVPVGNGKDELLYLTNLGCIDQNPWMSRVQSIDNPDYVLIDLDPYHAEYSQIVEAAQLVHALLDEIGLVGFPKTTGGDGMHIYVPIAPLYSYEQIKGVAELIARLLDKKHPDMFTLPRALSARTKGRVYFDWVQNGKGKTISAPYVVRPKPGAPVATPLKWEEVKAGLNPLQFNIRNAIERFRAVGDLFGPVLTTTQRLEKPIKALEKVMR